MLLWPLQLLPLPDGSRKRSHLDVLQDDPEHLWREVSDEFSVDVEAFQERHYREFVTFLPYVQRLFYGEGGGRPGGSISESPIKVYRRSDISRVRIAFSDREPFTFDIRHIDLYFFHDVDLAILAVEVSGSDVPLDVVQEMLHSFGRAYPSGWTERGEGLNCPRKVEWLSVDGEVLAASNYEDRQDYLASVWRKRASMLSAHWQYLLRPLVGTYADQAGLLRFRPLESYRMPLMAYLAVERIDQLTRADYVRLAYATGPGERDVLPFSERHLAKFEENCCYDRYFDPVRFENGLSIRLMCHDHAFVMVGDASRAFFTDSERGVLGQFRHQYFLEWLVVHMHKAALIMMSDRMVQAVSDLDTGRPETVRRFRGEIRGLLENFLRFTHRYWFQEVSDQLQARNVYRILVEHIGTQRLYADVREELQDMGAYLDSDLLRRQSMTFLRLTVVTIIGLIWTSATGFLGMNLYTAINEPLAVKVLYFVVATLFFTAITIYTLVKSQRLAAILDAVTDERLPLRAKGSALLDMWRKKREL